MGYEDRRMLMKRPRRDSGFTMIEMAVTMTIFAILVTVGVPSMSMWIRNNKVRTVSDSLQTGLRLAQAESLRRSRQVVFALTDTPNARPVAAAADAKSWAIFSVPSMTDGSEQPEFIQSGVLSNLSSNVQVISNGTAAICFNSVGRLTNNASASVVLITGGATCSQPTAVAPAIPMQKFNISVPGGDRPLQVNLGLGGQVHMCDPGVPLTDTHPEGCPP
jgi:type IV fimbrial biogenesis protein FimT